MAAKETIALLRAILKEHDMYWEQQAPELRKYKDAYSNKFWSNLPYEDGMIRVETSDAFAFIEGYIASLFSKSPAIEIGADEAIPGDTVLAKAVANRFLYNQREHFENASRMALIFNNSFLKLSHRESDNLLEQVTIKACPCWELVVDMDAASWEEQRYVGHVYYIDIPAAKKRFGDKQFSPVTKKDYLSNSVMNKSAALPDEYLYIQVLELYDLTKDKLYFWSPNYKGGDDILEQVEIPIRTYDNRPLPAIAPLYYARTPDKPLQGMSAMCRVYDQIYEKNVLRTYTANAVRRDSRQYIYKSSYFDEEQLAKITAGVDGAMIGVDSESLEGLIREVPVTPISSNFERYAQQIEADLNRGSILAPFTRGEATKATATEITALAQYTASEIGKMARDRDAAIESVAHIYLRILASIAGEEKAVIRIGSEAKTVTAQALDSKFRINALDQGSMPIADQIKRQNLVQLLPVLTQLGVPPEKIREEIIRSWDLPNSFLETPEEKAAREAAVRTAAESKIGPRSIPSELTVPEDATTPEDLAAALIGSAQKQGLE